MRRTGFAPNTIVMFLFESNLRRKSFIQVQSWWRAYQYTYTYTYTYTRSYFFFFSEFKPFLPFLL